MRAIDDFLHQVDLVYGHYLDCTMGFASIREKIVEMQTQLQPSFPGVDLDFRPFMFGFGGDPGHPTHVHQHTTTQGELKLRNSPGGLNYIRASQNLIVLLYAYWDSGYREKIANALQIKVKDLQVPIMGDLRRLRNDLAHCSGRLQAENAKKLEVLNTFKEGELIWLDANGVLTLVQRVKNSVSSVPPAYSQQVWPHQ